MAGFLSSTAKSSVTRRHDPPKCVRVPERRPPRRYEIGMIGVHLLFFGYSPEVCYEIPYEANHLVDDD